MITLSHKSKQYLLVALKVFILTLTFGYIYAKMNSDDSIEFETFINTITNKGRPAIGKIIFFIGLATANWSLEILKWQTVASNVKPMSLKTAMKQSLASLTISLATPNRIGDYGAKAYFFETSKRKQILLLNFFSNSTQMAITSIFGIIGLLYLVVEFSLELSAWKLMLFGLFVAILLILGYVFKQKELLIKGFTINKVLLYFKKLPSGVKIKTVLYSLGRYMIFSFLFYELLLFFGAEITLENAIFMIASMYLLVSIIPTLFIFDVVIRGGVAVWLFSMVEIPELSVLCAVLAMWLLNFVLPSILGSFYVISHKPK